MPSAYLRTRRVERLHQPERLLARILDILAADERQIFAELGAIEVEQHGAMAYFLVRHLVEDLPRQGRVGATLPQSRDRCGCLPPRWKSQGEDSCSLRSANRFTQPSLIFLIPSEMDIIIRSILNNI